MRWDHALGYTEQPGIEHHIGFMRSLAERGAMVLGGPFADGDATSTVGLAIVVAADAAEADRLAHEDRSIERGLIRVSVRPWTVPMAFALDTLPPTEEG